ncbi:MULTISPECIES: hypothetical protein [Pseudomonas]|uniref:hypothetical protein n=1 Tax=Pseudomonas TaxID=286 RepID=UPI00163D1C67|nr:MULTISPECIES: hypothetical protein [Pseudomonas]CAH0135986.1 hypothetical protein SRABI111_00339 [Pseudomonas carnis]CAH0138971.1 hypothetical protein SRABI110_00483 [Pseudomonas carnis]CAH0158111.1 hypothetical protein SRABI64_00709 [Pseudomonas carnis]CAH0202058.1 hypothetical protein SRABI08_01917 [Pseudomonas carnis]
MNKEYYTTEDAIEMSGLSAKDYFSFMEGDLVPEEFILPELFVNSFEDEQKLIKQLSRG